MNHRDDNQADELTAALHVVAQQLQALATESHRARTLISGLGRMLLAIAAQSDAAEQAETVTLDGHAATDGIAPHSEPILPASASTLTSLPLTPPPVVIAPIPRWNDWALDRVTNDDLAVTATRCRLKAECARWMIERTQLLHDDAPFHEQIEPRDRDLLARARQMPDSYLWMYRRDVLADEEIALYSLLAGCFDAAADAIALLREALAPADGPPMIEQALFLAAESQSALRVAVANLGHTTDRDQYRLFLWIKQYCASENVFVRRFMRMDDAADPSGWFDLRARIGQADTALQHGRENRKREYKLLNKARYHLKQITENPKHERLHDWQKVLDTINEMIEGGTPASSRDIRELLLPIVDAMPPALDISKPVRRVLDALDDYMASEPSNVPVSPTSNESADVRRARDLLRGRALVLIGGVRRPEAERQLCEALRLSDLFWIETREHQTHTVFEPYVARADVAVVLLAIRWSSHGFSEVQTFCERYGKPLVRLPGGYNANQVAHQIIAQASGQLVAEEPATSTE